MITEKYMVVGFAAVEFTDVARALLTQNAEWFHAQADTKYGMGPTYRRMAKDLCVLQAYLCEGVFALQDDQASLMEMGTTAEEIRNAAAQMRQTEPA